MDSGAPQQEATQPPGSPPLPDATPPPPPPRVNLGDDAPPPKSKGKPAEAHATPIPDGRQEFIGFLTAQWEGAMLAMTDELATIGVRPLIPVEVIKPAVHATIDQLVPKSFRASPPMLAAAGTTAITAQYYLNRKKLAEAKRAKEAKNANPKPDLEAMAKADAEARAKKKADDEAVARAMDAKLGASTTPPSSPPPTLAIVPAEPPPPPPPSKDSKRERNAKEAEEIMRNPNVVV